MFTFHHYVCWSGAILQWEQCRAPTRLSFPPLLCAQSNWINYMPPRTIYSAEPLTMETDTELIAASVLYNCLFAFLSYRIVSCWVTCADWAQRKWIKNAFSRHASRDKIIYGCPRFSAVFLAWEISLPADRRPFQPFVHSNAVSDKRAECGCISFYNKVALNSV